MLRVLSARRNGLRYHPYAKGHITQFERGLYARSWAYSEGGYLTRGRTVEHVPPRTDSEISGRTAPDGVTILILDQELHQIVDGNLESSMRRALLRQARLLSAERILYKAHPRGGNRARELQLAGLPVEDTSSSSLAEDLICSEGVSAVVGFYSTPIVLSGDLVDKRISIFPDEGLRGIRRPRLVAEIRQALRASGATIVSPNESVSGS
jgi:hypothetical protein